MPKFSLIGLVFWISSAYALLAPVLFKEWGLGYQVLASFIALISLIISVGVALEERILNIGKAVEDGLQNKKQALISRVPERSE